MVHRDAAVVGPAGQPLGVRPVVRLVADLVVGGPQPGVARGAGGHDRQPGGLRLLEIQDRQRHRQRGVAGVCRRRAAADPVGDVFQLDPQRAADRAGGPVEIPRGRLETAAGEKRVLHGLLSSARLKISRTSDVPPLRGGSSLSLPLTNICGTLPTSDNRSPVRSL